MSCNGIVTKSHLLTQYFLFFFFPVNVLRFSGLGLWNWRLPLRQEAFCVWLKVKVLKAVAITELHMAPLLLYKYCKVYYTNTVYYTNMLYYPNTVQWDVETPRVGLPGSGYQSWYPTSVYCIWKKSIPHFT